MQKITLIVVLAMIVPSALAHPLPGPKDFCETSSDWFQHDYWGSAGSGALLGPYDGNDAGDCDGNGIWGDYDGHKEFAIGGGYLAFDNGGIYMTGPWAGVSWGSQACLDEAADHWGSYVTVSDAVLGGNVDAVVAADWSRNDALPYVDPTTGTLTICGDHVIEPCDETNTVFGAVEACNPNDHAAACFPDVEWSPPGNRVALCEFVGAGQNGALEVFVLNGTAGHIGDY